MVEVDGGRVRLRTAAAADVEALVRIRETPEVRARWRGDDIRADVVEALGAEDREVFAIEDETGAVIGAVQWSEEDDPEYRHASMDLFLDPAVHGRGLGTDTVRTLARHLFETHGHHRLTIDPAADNAPAIRCYAKAGFREVGVMRQYELGDDGTWHDGLLMELLADDFRRQE